MPKLNAGGILRKITSTGLAFTLSGVQLLPSFAFAIVLDKVIRHQNHNLLGGVLFLLLVFFCVEVIVEHLLRWQIEKMANDETKGAEENFLEILLRAEFELIEKETQAKLHRIYFGIRELSLMRVDYSIWHVVAPVVVTVILLILFFVNVKIASLMLILGAAYSYILGINREALKATAKDLNVQRSKFYGKTGEIFGSLLLVRIFGAYDFFRIRLNAGLSEIENSSRRHSRLSNWNNSIGDAYQRISLMIVLGLGTYEAFNASISVGGLVMANMLSRHLASNVRKMAALREKRSKILLASEELLKIQKFPTSNPGFFLLKPSRRLIFCDLGFRYNATDDFIFRNLNGTINFGEMTVVTGPSGCGKTTFLKNLAGIYQPTEGSVSFDSNAQVESSVRAAVGYLPQLTPLLSGTLLENIALARADVSLDQSTQALEQAGAGNVATKLGGINTGGVLDFGSNLSVGERQRVGLARALAGNPLLLLLDEPTASIDAAAKSIVIDTLRKRAKECICIVATHDKALIAAADNLIDLSDRGDFKDKQACNENRGFL